MSTKEKWILIGSAALGIALMLAVTGAYTQNALTSPDTIIAVTGGDVTDIHACCAKLRGTMHPAHLIAYQLGVDEVFGWFGAGQ